MESVPPDYTSSPSNVFKVSWKNVNVFARLPSPSLIARIKNRNVKTSRKKQILHDVSGEAYSKHMLAIMGESGSGKTTLLNILAGVHSRKIKAKGTFLLNDKPCNFVPFSTYVEQVDLFIPTITVREHLDFNAKLVLGQSYSDAQLRQKVDELLREFGLEKCKNNQIGSEQSHAGISGGEKRRLAIASQVMANPRIIFLDEPTSSLDSFTAESVIQILKKLASMNCAIICTIHQPSSQIFSHFDSLLLLASGRVVYSGPRELALDYFARAGFKCPTNFNPCDFYIETVALKSGREAENQSVIEQLRRTSVHEADISTEIEQPMYGDFEIAKELKQRKKLSFSKQFGPLLKRAWLSTVRDRMLFRSRIIQVIFIGLLYGLIYMSLTYDVDNIMNFTGALFGLATQNTFSGVYGVVYIFPSQLAVFRREHRQRLYDTSTYYLTKTLVDIPVFLLMPSILLVMCYFLIGLNPTAEAFFQMLFICMLISQCGIAYGYFISSLANNFQIASAISAPLIIPLMIFGGFFIRTTEIPIYFVWISYISWFRYSFDALCSAQFTGVQLACNGTVRGCPPGTTFADKSYVVSLLGLNDYGFLINTMALLSLIIGFRIITLIILSIKIKIHER